MRKKIIFMVSIIVFLIGTLSAVQAKVINLVWVYPGTTGPEIVYAKSITEDFNKQYAGQIHLECSFIGYANVVEKILAMCAAGTPPDMLYANPELNMRDLYSMGYLYPLTEWVKDWPGLKHIYPPLLEQVTMGGKIFMLPTCQLLLFTGGHYRPQIIKKFWGDPENIKTWDDYVSVLKAVHNKDYEGHKVYGAVWGHHFNPLDVIKALGRNNGPMDLADFLDPTKKDAWIESLDMYQKMAQYLIPGAETMIYSDCDVAFANQLVAFYVFAGSWQYGAGVNIAPEACTKERLAFLVGPAGPSHTLSHPVAAGKVYGPIIFKDIPADHKEAAWKFCSFAASKENVARRCGVSDGPSRDDVSMDSITKWSPVMTGQPAEAYRWYAEAIIGASKHSVPAYQVLGAQEVMHYTKDVLLDLERNKITPEEAYSKIYRDLFEIWERIVCE